MKAIDYLKQIEELNIQINKKIRAAEKWREMAYKITADPSEDHYNPNRPTSAPFEKCFEKADELEREADSDIDRLADLKFEVSEKISLVDDEVSQEILRLRYVELQAWENVINGIGLSKSQVFNKRKQALLELDKKLKDF